MPNYNDYYQTEELFGAPYPELVQFFQDYPYRGKLLDLGCGQGRDALAIARLGYEVLGIDSSTLGIAQMLEKAKLEKLSVRGLVADIYAFADYADFDFILLDSMFHFNKKDKKKESDFIQQLLSRVKPGVIIVFCLQDTGQKVTTLKKIIDIQSFKVLKEMPILYEYKDDQSGHTSVTNYKMVVIKKHGQAHGKND